MDQNNLRFLPFYREPSTLKDKIIRDYNSSSNVKDFTKRKTNLLHDLIKKN